MNEPERDSFQKLFADIADALNQGKFAMDEALAVLNECLVEKLTKLRAADQRAKELEKMAARELPPDHWTRNNHEGDANGRS